MSILSVNRNSTVKLVKQIENELNEFRKQTQKNIYIRAVYKYDDTNIETKCITGEEETCTELTTETYEVGTIVKYRVNNTEDKFFYVIQDNGDTITLIARENTVSGNLWATGESITNASGPTNIIEKLSATTNTWTNVNDQTYTMGTTPFQGNIYTGCSTTGCTTNTYSWSEKKAKARLITFQEAKKLNCEHNTTQSCKTWLYNYLTNSTSYGGTETGPTTCYWTMNTTNTNTNTTEAWAICNSGILTTSTINQAYYGGRAVVVVNKKQ